MYNKSFKGDVCSHSHSIFLDNFIRRIIQNPKRILGEYIHKGDTIVDIGCGPGYFTLDMAQMAGPTGKTIAVDLQEEMLATVESKAIKSGLMDRIRLHQCTQEKIGLEEKEVADFILTYYMVHETLNPRAFLSEILGLLKPGGKYLIVEPLFHVSAKQFNTIKRTALDLGFTLVDTPKKKGGRSVLLTV